LACNLRDNLFLCHVVLLSVHHPAALSNHLSHLRCLLRVFQPIVLWISVTIFILFKCRQLINLSSQPLPLVTCLLSLLQAILLSCTTYCGSFIPFSLLV
jgi:hypothetical protein